MVNAKELASLQQLAPDELWIAHRSVAEEGFIVDDEQGTRLRSLPTSVLVEPDLQTPLDDIRRLSQAVAHGAGRFEADDRYNDLEEVLRRTRALSESRDLTKIAHGIEALRLTIVTERNRRYVQNARKLGQFIAKSDDIYLGFGPSGATQIHVARLESVGVGRNGTANRRQPVAVLRGKNDKRGLKPRMNTRHELFEVH